MNLEILYVDIVDGDSTLLGEIESLKQLDDGRFSAPWGSHKSYFMAI